MSSRKKQPTWDESVEKALTGSKRAIYGRFQVALASFEQIPPNATGVPMRRGVEGMRSAGRTLYDFADDVGMNRETLVAYRSCIYWWFESDLSLELEIGVPEDINWSALLWARRRWPLSQEFRDTLAMTGPPNGKIWSIDDIQYLYDSLNGGAEPVAPKNVEAFDTSLATLTNMGARVLRTYDLIKNADLSEQQRSALMDAAEKARKRMNFMVNFLAGAEIDMEELAESYEGIPHHRDLDALGVVAA